MNRIGDVMNKKGFTLVELLVVIVIIGLISYIGFPSLMALINNNKTTEFEIYGNLMVDAAKLYIRKEAIDLQEAEAFKNGRKQEVQLSYLIEQEYVNKFVGSKKSIVCDDDNTAAVQISYTPSNGTYTFKYKLVCKDKAAKKKYTKTYNTDQFEVSNLN